MANSEFTRLQTTTFFGALVASSIGFYILLSGYIYPIFWAVVLAAISWPLQRKLTKLARDNRSAAAIATITILVLIILVPLSGFVSLLAQQAIQVYQQFGNQETVVTISDYLTKLTEYPLVSNWLGTVDIQSNLQNWAGEVGKIAYQFAADSGQTTIRTVISFFIMLYTLYFFLRDGDNILKRLRYLLPLGDEHENQLFSRFVSTSKATLKGTLIIGLIQGMIGGASFVITGVPGWAFWMVVMILLSVIPAVGAGLVLVPAAVVYAVIGGWWQAIVIIVAALIASVIDNILRGPLVGKDAQMHPLLIFFSTIGGLVVFGISGVVIGPVITALFISLWEMYADKYKKDLSKAD